MGGRGRAQGVCDDSDPPRVNRIRMPLLIQNLRSRIPRTPTDRSQHLILLLQMLRNPEIRNDQIVRFFRAVEKVFGFEVSVDYAV